jgi:hypothetical protein
VRLAFHFPIRIPPITTAKTDIIQNGKRTKNKKFKKEDLECGAFPDDVSIIILEGSPVKPSPTLSAPRLPDKYPRPECVV